MALTVAELRAVFSADDRQFLAALGRMDRAGASMQQAGSRVTRGVTLPILAAGAAAFKAGKDFNWSKGQMVALAGESERSAQRLSRQVLRLARVTSQSPQELIEALQFITSSGFSGASAMKVLEASAKASAAGLGETASVADAVTSAVNAYGEKSLSASRATDILVAAVREGKAEASEMAPVIGRVIPLASELGVSFDQVAASMAAMSRTGMDANESSTATMAILRQLITQSPMGVKALKSVGLSYDEVRASIREKGLLATLFSLRDAFDGNLPKMRAVFQDSQAMTGVLALTGKQASTNAGIFKSLAGATGDTDEAFKSASKTTDFQWKTALNGLKVALIEAGDAVTPLVLDLTNGLADVTGEFSNLTPQQQKWVLVVAASVAALGPLLFILGTVVRTFSLLATAVAFSTKVLGLNTAAVALSRTTLGTWLGVKALELSAWVKTTAAAVAHRVASIAGTAATKAMTAAQWLLNAALRANPIGIVITLLAALAAGVIYAYNHSSTFRRIVDAAFRAVAAAGKWMWDNVLKPVFEFLRDAFRRSWEAARTMADVLKVAWQASREATRLAVLWIVEKLAWFAERAVGLVAKAFGWAPVVGDKLKAAHEKVAAFREKVNRELDGIQDEAVYVNVRAQMLKSMQSSDPGIRRAARAAGTGGAGVSGFGNPAPAAAAAFGGAGGPDFRARTNTEALGAVRKRAGEIAAKLATDMRSQVIAQARQQAARGPGGPGRVLPKGSYRIGMPYLGYPGHYGADYPAPTGTPVRAAHAGLVQRALSLTYSYGKHVFLGHPGGVQTRYAHLSGIAVRPGQAVSAGQLIGWVGSTGNSSAPHLHFEYRRNGAPINPASTRLFDSGGWLLPGVTVPVNKTGRPEAVLSPEESAAFVRIARQMAQDGGRGGGDQIFNVTAASPQPHDVARATALAVRLAT